MLGNWEIWNRCVSVSALTLSCFLLSRNSSFGICLFQFFCFQFIRPCICRSNLCLPSKISAPPQSLKCVLELFAVPLLLSVNLQAWVRSLQTHDYTEIWDTSGEKHLETLQWLTERMTCSYDTIIMWQFLCASVRPPWFQFSVLYNSTESQACSEVKRSECGTLLVDWLVMWDL